MCLICLLIFHHLCNLIPEFSTSSSKNDCCNLIYHCRKYAQRRIHDGFKKNKNISDPDLINNEYKEALMNLELIKRQVTYYLKILVLSFINFIQFISCTIYLKN